MPAISFYRLKSIQGNHAGNPITIGIHDWAIENTLPSNSGINMSF